MRLKADVKLSNNIYSQNNSEKLSCPGWDSNPRHSTQGTQLPAGHATVQQAVDPVTNWDTRAPQTPERSAVLASEASSSIFHAFFRAHLETRKHYGMWVHLFAVTDILQRNSSYRQVCSLARATRAKICSTIQYRTKATVCILAPVGFPCASCISRNSGWISSAFPPPPLPPLPNTQTHTNSNMWWDFRLVRDFPFHETTNTTGMKHIFGERSKRFDFSRVSRVFRTWQFQYIYINGTITH